VPSCPLPTCRRQSAARASEPEIRLPPDSTVAYYPRIVQQPPTASQADHIVTVPNPQIDVTVNRVLELLHRSQARASSSSTQLERVTHTAEQSGSDQDSSSDEEDHSQVVTSTITTTTTTSRNIPQPGPYSSTAHAPSSSSSAHPDRQLPPPQSPQLRPRKRRRRLDRSTPPCSLRRSFVDSPTSARLTTDVDDRFYKELHEQLTCEICFVLLYLPVTTPCGHVSIDFFEALVRAR
jgi:hypothetical protein